MHNFKSLFLTNKVLILSFLLPFLIYIGIFFGKSFGAECAAGVMGMEPPYQQSVTEPNSFCARLADPGAYAWQHIPQWLKVGTEYSSFNLPIWNQNTGIGVPLAANFISLGFFLPLIPFAIAFSFFKSVFVIDLFFVFRMAIASLGMYLFLRSLRLPKALSLIGSVLIFLNGFMTTLPSISHQSVDVLLPWIAFLMTKGFQEKKVKYFASLSLATSISHFGGNPESTVFVSLFYFTYAAFLALFMETSGKIKLFLHFVLSFILSLGLAALLLIPGLEYINHSNNVHKLGDQQLYAAPFINAIFMIFPFLLGSFRSKAYDQVLFWLTPNYIGAFFSFFLVFPTFLLLDIKSKIKKLPNWKYFIFFILFLLVLMIQYLDVFRIPVFTKLPGFSQTNFPKYSLSLVNLLIASIVPFSIYYFDLLTVSSKDLKEKLGRSLPLILTYISFFIISFIAYRLLNKIAVSQDFFPRFQLQLLFGIGVATSVFLVSLFVKTKVRYILFLLICITELSVFIPSMRGDAERRDTLRKPPAFTFLQNKDYKESRIFSPDYILYPDFSAVYDLNDVRSLDALWPKDYYNYLKSFVVPEMDNTVNRFTGIRDGTSTDAKFVNNPFFDLTSVKYFLSYNDLNAYEDLGTLKPFLAQISETASLRSDIFTIKGISKPVLFEHAPGKVEITIAKPKGAKNFYLYPALSDKVFDVKNPGDGVRFVVNATANGETIFNKDVTINPKINKLEQKWLEIAIASVPENASQLTLTLETDPLANNTYDWSGWGGFEWDTELSKPKSYQFKKIYDQEMKVYENEDFVPRLHSVSEIKCAKNEAEILNKMRADESSIKNLGVVLSNNCIEKKLGGQNVNISKAKFDDQKITFNYSSKEDAYVILSNLHYPGWKLKVNGKNIPIERVNYTFQGLSLPKGKNVKVEVVYESLSFKIGGLITLISLLVSATALWKFPNKKIDQIFFKKESRTNKLK